MDGVLTVGEITAVIVAVLLCGAAFMIAWGMICGKITGEKYTVVVPCHVGDTLYLPWEFDGCDGIAVLHVERIVASRRGVLVETDFDSDDLDYLKKYKFGCFSAEDFGRIVYRTRAEATTAQSEEEKK